VKGNSPVPKKRTSVIIKTFGSNEKEKSVNDKNSINKGSCENKKNSETLSSSNSLLVFLPKSLGFELSLFRFFTSEFQIVFSKASKTNDRSSSGRPIDLKT
jgi:hypothetical protein